MFITAFFLGVYAYALFILGIVHLLYVGVIIILTYVFLGLIFWWRRKNIFIWLKELNLLKYKQDKITILFCLILLTQVFVNLLGAFGPELGFDALWYHLTLPKLYLEHHAIYFIPGGLLYYSAMPKLAEMLYVAGLSFGNETIPKLIHFLFGLLTSFALYRMQRKFFNPVVALTGVCIFYLNLVVAWESITAYIDLIRAFFEIMALWGFINWWETQKKKWLIISALLLGFAITTKLLAVGSLAIFVVLIFLRGVRDAFIYLFTSLLVPLPWFIFSYINTGNPVYPFFTQLYRVAPGSLSLVGFLRDTWNLFIHSSDPLSPIYLIFFPLVVWFFSHFNKQTKLIIIYSLLALIIWYFTPRTGGGRFIVPYLPAFSFICAAVYNEVLKDKKLWAFSRVLLGIIFVISLITISYRFFANKRYIPVIAGTESKKNFLTNNLNFSFGDYYDIDGYFEKTILSTDKVLLYGFHNLYYINFPYVEATWVKPGDTFNYIATQNTPLPERFYNWQMIYENKQSMVKLYKPPINSCKKICAY